MRNSNKILISLIIVLLPVLLLAQTGKVYDNLTVKSKILDMERKFALYLPPDYETSERSYPVLYLLHGGGDDHTGWVQFGEVLRITDQAIADGIATPMIIVMPDANTGRRGYQNDIAGKWRYEDFIFEELIPYVESNWRIKGEKKYRAVAGLSMGGNGTLLYALHHPSMFSSACPLSAAARMGTFEELKERMERAPQAGERRPMRGMDDWKAFSEQEQKAYFESQSAIFMMENMPEDTLKSIRWYFDCGDDDFLYEGNSMLHIIMRQREIPHEFRIRDGAHNWTYWRHSLPEVLRFVSDAFHQH